MTSYRHSVYRSQETFRIDAYTSFTSTQAFHHRLRMYHSNALGALLVTGFLQKFAASQFSGTILPYGTDGDGIVLVTIQNESTGNYSIEARNNLFDEKNPYRPLTVKNLAGQRVIPVGSQYPYPQISDDAFIPMNPGAIWQRELNMTEYIPADPNLTVPTSQCFTIGFTSGIFAVNTTDFVAGEQLATGFLGGNSVEIRIKSPPIHLNITVEPEPVLGPLPPTATSTATPVGAQPAATLVQGTGAPGFGGSTSQAGTNIDDYTQGRNLYGPNVGYGPNVDPGTTPDELRPNLR